VVALVAVTGCQRVVETAASKAVEQSTGVQVSTKGDSITVKGKDGETVTIGGGVSAELKDFPVPPGFQPEKDGFGQMSSGGDGVSVGSWSGSLTAQAAGDFYSKTMKDQGWTEDSNMKSGEGGQWTFSKGDRQAMVTIEGKGSSSKVTVLLGKPAGKAGAAAAGVAANAAASAASSAGVATPPVVSQPAAAAAAAAPPAAAPKTGSASSVPDELKAIPAPSGFTVVDGSTMRMAQGGKFQGATAQYFGKSTVKEVREFYKKSLTDWNEDFAAEAGDQVTAVYSDKKGAQQLSVSVGKTDAGTEVTLALTPKS
jgi:hypothetical protein